MTGSSKNHEIWFVYDGDCPVCTMAAEALRIRKEFGTLRLLNAREARDHPLVIEINKRQLDLDEGMVIKEGEHFYHGADALRFMSTYGAPTGLFNRFNRLLFRSRKSAETLYPLMRGCRNTLVKLRGVGRINNLAHTDKPIFKPIFGKDWAHLPPIMLFHYQNKPYSTDKSEVAGLMSVKAVWYMRLLGPLAPILGLVPVKNGTNIPVTVVFESENNGTGLYFNRIFRYPGTAPVRFKSKMVPVGGNKIVEQLRCGLGWRVAFNWENDRVLLKHQGYAFCMFGVTIPLPLNWLLGRVHAEEWITGDNSFAMFVEITHSLFGKIYEYRGEFEKVASND